MRTILIACAAVLLAGCSTPGNIFSDSDLVCANMGFAKGTPEYGACVMDNERIKAQRSTALSAWGTATYQAGQPTYYPRMQTTCVQQGAFLNCF